MTDGPKRIFDFPAQALHRARAARMTGERFLYVKAAEEIAARISYINRTFARRLDVEGRMGAALPDVAWHKGGFDEDERLDTGEGAFDLAVSVLSLHAINDLPGALVQIRQALKPDGVFVGAMFGGATLFELRDAFAAGEIETTGGVSPRVAPFADVRDAGALLQRAGFAMPVADVERTTVLYRDFSGLVRDLRLMGETNALVERSGKFSRATLKAALGHYAANYAEAGGRLRATFDIIYLTGWAPDESQPKPLRPGSAKTRLADALGVTEHKTQR